jgi:hypothetical protein
VDIKALKTYQQVFIYITPIVTNLGFINVLVVVVRLRWFSQRLKGLGMFVFANVVAESNTQIAAKTQRPRSIRLNSEPQHPANVNASNIRDVEEGETVSEKRPALTERTVSDAAHIKFAPEPPRDKEKTALYVAGPLEGQHGKLIRNVYS